MIRSAVTGRWQEMPSKVHFALSHLHRWYEFGEQMKNSKRWALRCKVEGLIAHDRIIRE